MTRRLLVPLLFFLLLLSACGDLENAGSVTQPDEPRPPEGAFGVSETFSGPYLGSEGPITDPADERILEVEPGGKFFVRALYESPSGITDITVSLINPSPEGLAGPLDPSRSFFTIGAPTSVSEPGGGCELTGEDGAVTCIYEVQVAEDAVNVDELEGAEGEFAYVFQPQATNAAGATSDEDLRGYVVIEGEGDETPEPKPEPEVCTDPVNIPDEVLRSELRDDLGLAEDAEINCEDLARLTEFSYSTGGNIVPAIESLEGLQYAINLISFSLRENYEVDYSPLANLTSLENLSLFDGEVDDLSFVANLTNLVTLNVESFREDPDLEDLTPLQNLTKLENFSLVAYDEAGDEATGNINNIRPLQGLTNLKTLNLLGQPVENLDPLTANSGLAEGDTVTLGYGSCPDEAYSASVTALRERGVTVELEFDRFLLDCDTDNGGDNEDTLTVTTTSDAASLEDECTLRAAITAANTDQAVGGCPAGNGADTIVLADETYTLSEVDNNTNGSNGLPAITSEITLRGSNSAVARAEDAPGFRLLYIAEEGNLTVEGVTLRNGLATDSPTRNSGGGIFNAGTLTLQDAGIVQSSAGAEGSGLDNQGTATIRDSLISENEGGGGNGVGIFNVGTLNLSDTTISDNFGGNGAGIFNRGDVTVEGGVLEGNTDPSTAGAILNDSAGKMELRGTVIRDNGDDGSTLTNRGEMTLRNVTYENNRNGIFNFEEATLTLVESIISGTGQNTPGLSNAGTLRIEGSTVEGNSLGGIVNSGTAEIVGSMIRDNRDEEYDDEQEDGIINGESGTLTLIESSITGSGGSGFRNSGTAEVVRSSIYTNGTPDPFTDGGEGSGVVNSGTVMITNSTVSGNLSGGGLVNQDEGTLEVTYSSIVSFSSNLSAGITNLDDGSVTVFGTIISGDFSCLGPVNSQGYNTISGNNDCDLIETDIYIYGTDSGLSGPIKDNGGPTLTYALEEDGVEVDAIPADVCDIDIDQRGVSRPQGEACDIGAFELEQ